MIWNYLVWDRKDKSLDSLLLLSIIGHVSFCWLPSISRGSTENHYWKHCLLSDSDSVVSVIPLCFHKRNLRNGGMITANFVELLGKVKKKKNWKRKLRTKSKESKSRKKMHFKGSCRSFLPHWTWLMILWLIFVFINHHIFSVGNYFQIPSK